MRMIIKTAMTTIVEDRIILITKKNTALKSTKKNNVMKLKLMY